MRAQREHVTGAHDVAGFRVIGNRGADRGHPVNGGYARRHALACFDRHRERGAVFAAVVGDHGRQVSARTVSSGRHRHTMPLHSRIISAMPSTSRRFSGVNQVGFVLAIVVVEQDDRAAFAQRLQRSGNSRRKPGASPAGKLRNASAKAVAGEEEK
jgi:hypothetical protein